MVPNLEIRSYAQESPNHQHDFAQLVLPIGGRMQIDVGGLGGVIDQSLAALIMPGSSHSQLTEAHNRFLVLDCEPKALETIQLDCLAQKIYVPISPATRRLIEFAELVGNEQLSIAARQLVPLLLSSLSNANAQYPSPIEQLIARLRAHPGAAWSNEAMARAASMSTNQLHHRFQQLFGRSPQAWLTDLRLHEARRLLGTTLLPIADIALRVGFSDQAAMTRTMQRVCRTTPAAYRRTQIKLG
ncbi:helix-turn-helix domain-containing protein [Pseudomonas putida]